jgi:hypothetical protein
MSETWFRGEVNRELVERLVDERINRAKRLRKVKMKRKHHRKADRGGRIKP